MDSSKHPRVGVGAIVLNSNNNVLLQLRKKPPEVNCWSIPGGKVEFLENIEDAIVRELHEELGIKTNIERLLCVTNHVLPEENAHWVSPAFLVRVIDGTPKNMEPNATKEIKWFSFNDLPSKLTKTTRSAVDAYLNVKI